MYSMITFVLILSFIKRQEATLFSAPLVVTPECNADVLAQELVGPNVVVLNASITGGYSNGNDNNDECKQFGTFVNGTGITYYTLEDDFNDVVFMRRGITLSTGTVTYANEVENTATSDSATLSLIRSSSIENDVVPELDSIRQIGDFRPNLYVNCI